uniref:Long-chain fatty acid transport protein n=1 Tax=uncultured microorganism TaxID=358574 RepID=F8UHY2_9ZZZZ|nr:long-chain fatty acid transport protein [uncultured microorganism]
MNTTRLFRALALAGLAVPTAALATDGYFSHAYGLKSLGMGGATVAVANEPFGGAGNPAAMTSVGNAWQAGVQIFMPRREAERTGSGPAGIDGAVSSDSLTFAIPEFGINYMARPDLAVGVTVVGNGGMNTDFAGEQIPTQSACAVFNPNPGPYNLLCGNGRLGVDLMQLLVAPYAAWKFAPSHSVGVAPTFAYQRFRAQGLQAFDNPMLSTSPGDVTNREYASSTGYGVRVGYHGTFDRFSVGLAWASRMSMDEFDKYQGLYAEQGGFDIPSNVTAGVAFRPNDQWLVAVDWERINYTDAKSVSNPSALLLNCVGGDPASCMGGANGPGFGWKDIDVWKFGVEYAANPKLTLRAGYNRSENPVDPADVTFNILAPGVIENHYTAGATWRLDANAEVTFYGLYAANNEVTGTSLFVPFGAPPTTTEKIQLKEYTVGVGYSSRF